MAKVWKITRWDGNESSPVGTLPGHFAESAIANVLQRLLCRELTVDEILRSSLRKDTENYSPLLERVGRGRPMSYGTNPHYSAEVEN